MQNISSPCKKRCSLNAEGTMCITCFRYLKEIIAWKNGLSDKEKEYILTQLSLRKEEYEK